MFGGGGEACDIHRAMKYRSVDPRELRTELAPVHLPAAADFLKFHKGSKEELPSLDPL